MLSNAIEALYIFDQHNESILEHVYRSRPASARLILPLYLAHPTPRPSLIYLPNVNPPTVLFSVIHNNLLFLSPVSTETEPLFVLEFLHRVIDVLDEFIGDPLLATKIEGNYDVVAQLLGEMCDAGSVCNTEPNALRDDVDVSGFLGKLLGGVALPGSSPALLPSGGLKQQMSLNPTSNGPAIPWRRANVRHTSNELYVDIVESLSVTLAPSGRPLAAFANGSIAFTSKISGVPDLLLTLSASGGKLGMEKAIELPVFHPCVRLARWKERPGELSFVPPDGKFMLAGYEVNLMPSNLDLKSWSNTNLQLPVSIEVTKSLGLIGADFEVRLILSSILPGASTSASASRPNLGTRGSGRSTPIFGSSASGPTLQDVVVTVPVPKAVRNITDLRASRGEAYFTPADNVVEWRLLTKDAAAAGNATLRCTIVGPLTGDDEDGANGFTFDAANGDYDDKEETYQSSALDAPRKSSAKEQNQSRDQRKIQQNASFMPSSASVSFSVKGWLASGIRVDGLVLDTRKSRGLGEGVKPYKGVKYLTVSKKGVETSAELSEAINSMYQWYERADVCYVYLVDLFRHYLDDTSRLEDFGRSRWFSRGWTLQELLAPPAVVFYDCEWREATSIPLNPLAEPKNADVAAKTSWAFQRDTARVGDIAYCLMGIFDVNMPLLYGEGDRTFLRLQHEILRASEDKSLFAWGSTRVTAARNPTWTYTTQGAAIDEFLGMSEDESLFAYGNATLASRHTGISAPSPGAFREAGDLITVKHPTLANAQSLYHDLVHPDASTEPPTLSQMAALAAKNAHPSILSFCFSEGLTLNPELVNDPLIYATCDSGSVAVFRVLVDHGMDVDRYLELGGSPLVSACQAGNVELARFLLDRGADPNNGYALGDYEALVRAIVGSNASLDLVELLLARGTVVKGTGALIAAAEHGNLGAVRLLLKHGKRTGDLDLEETEVYGAYDQRKLDDQGAALYSAAAKGYSEIVDHLLEKGADPGFTDRKGRSVADVAQEKGHGGITGKMRWSVK